MRKMAYCNQCEKQVRLEVEAVVIATFCPTTNQAICHGFGDVIIRCAACYSSPTKTLSSDEIDELTNAAVEEIGSL